jgi:hypothetical protein
VTANVIDLPSPPDPPDATYYPVGVWVSDDSTYISANILVENNLLLGPANPAIEVTANPSASIAVTGNLSPSAAKHFSGQPDVSVSLVTTKAGLANLDSSRSGFFA